MREQLVAWLERVGQKVPAVAEPVRNWKWGAKIEKIKHSLQSIQGRLTRLPKDE